VEDCGIVRLLGIAKKVRNFVVTRPGRHLRDQGASAEVGLGGWAVAHLRGGDRVDGAVESSVPALVEPVTHGSAAARLERAGAGEGGDAASLRQRPGWERDTMVWAALTEPMPRRSVNPGRGR